MDGGKVIYHFEADDSDLKKSTSRVGDIIKGNLISSAVTTGISKVVGGIKNVTSSINNLAVQGGFNRALNIEQAEFKLKGLGHSAEETQAIMDNALASVKGTAYGLDEAATVAASAVAAGIKPGKELERTLKLVGDAATISGRDMQSMGAIFNKVAAAGKLTGQELNQLTDAGIPVLQLLADTMGVTAEEARDMVSAGEVSFEDFQNAIEKGMGGAALTMGETFSGAVSNTKAAMSRLGKTFMDPFMKGMTPVLGTITSIIDNITSGSLKNIDNLVATLGEQIESGLIGLIENLEPILSNFLKVVEKLLPKLIKVIEDMLPYIAPVVMNLITSLIRMLADNIPEIINLGIQMLLELVNGITNAAPTLIPQIVTAIIDGILTILDNVDLLIDAGIQLLFGLMDGIIKALPVLIDKLPEIIDKIVNALVDNLPKLLEAGVRLTIELAKGLIKAIPQLISKIPQIGSSIVNGIGKFVSNMADVGKNLIKGLWEGIKNVTGWIIDKIKGFGSSVLKAIKGIFGIHSPSTEFEWIGKMNMVGFEEGMEGMKNQVQDTIDSVFNLQPNVSGQMSSAYSPNMVINVQNNMEFDPLGQLVNNVKTFSGGAKNDYNWGSGL